MDAIKFSDKALSVFPMAFYFSTVKAFEERIRAAECGQERFQRMRDEYSRLFVAFDEAYKRTQKSELTAKITALDKERDGYAYVMQKVAEAWAAKLEDEALAVHGRRVAQVFRDYGFRTSEALVAENAKIHNMEQKLADRELTADLQAALEKLDGHYRAFITYLNAVQELQPEESLSKAAQYYNADLAKIDLQYQQSRKKGGKEEDEPLAATPEQPEASL